MQETGVDTGTRSWWQFWRAKRDLELKEIKKEIDKLGNYPWQEAEVKLEQYGLKIVVIIRDQDYVRG